MENKSIGPVVFLVFFFGLACLAYLLWNPHKDDDRLRAECKARGGVFIEARDPLHVCVSPR